MKWVQEVSLRDFEMSVVQFDRTTIKEQIRDLWCSGPSAFGIQYLFFNGVTIEPGRILLERKDIIMCQFRHKNPPILFNVFLFVEEGKVDIQGPTGLVLTFDDKHDIKALCHAEWQIRHEFVRKHEAWFKSEPWKLCYGKTPIDAVKALQAAGW